MDNRDVERLSELLEFQRRLVEAQIKLAGKLAENQNMMGQVVYDEHDFNSIILECQIGYNDFPY